VPERRGLEPEYEQKEFPAAERRGRLRLLASPDRKDGSLAIHQDVRLYATLLGRGQKAAHDLAPGRYGWIQVARGRIQANGTVLEAGDGAAISKESRIELEGAGGAEAEVLLFDLA
ncbi:MAG TPA: pirin family protein, partial [Candidatus Eisenbacteria bacterium]